MVGSGKEEENKVKYPVNRQYLGKKTQIEKKNTFQYLRISTDLEIVYGNCSRYMIYGNLRNTHQTDLITLSKISPHVVRIISNLLCLEIFADNLSYNLHVDHETPTFPIVSDIYFPYHV